MSDHGTISTFPGWYIRFQQAALAALPRPPELDQDTGLGWADNGEAMKRVLAEVLVPKRQETASTVFDFAPTNLTYPVDGEVFDLTINGDAAENDPIEMVRRDGYSHVEEWKYTGERIIGVQTRRFKLVSIGYHRIFIELTRKLANHGTIPEGQWREAFKFAYQHDGKGSIGIADSSWVDPDGHAYFPYVGLYGRSFFGRSDYDFRDGWRWLVEVSK